jgi:hypothetical protein
MRRHYESAHSFPPEQARAMQCHHRTLTELAKRRLANPVMDRKEIGARPNFICNSLLKGSDLPCASRDFSEILMPLSMVNAIMDGLGKGDVLLRQNARILYIIAP